MSSSSSSSSVVALFLLGVLSFSGIHGQMTTPLYSPPSPDNTVGGSTGFDLFGAFGLDTTASPLGGGLADLGRGGATMSPLGISSGGSNTTSDFTGLGDLFYLGDTTGGGAGGSVTSSPNTAGSSGGSLDQLVNNLFGSQSPSTYDTFLNSSDTPVTTKSGSGSEMLAPGVTLFDMTNLLTAGSGGGTTNDSVTPFMSGGLSGANPLDNTISSGPTGGTFTDVLNMLGGGMGGGIPTSPSTSSSSSTSPVLGSGGPTSVFGGSGGPTSSGLPTGAAPVTPGQNQNQGQQQQKPNPLMPLVMAMAMGGGEMGEGMDFLLPMMMMRQMNNNNNKGSSNSVVSPGMGGMGGMGGMSGFGGLGSLLGGSSLTGSGGSGLLGGGGGLPTGASTGSSNDLVSLLFNGFGSGTRTSGPSMSSLSPTTNSGPTGGSMGLLDSVMGPSASTSPTMGGTGSALEAMFNSMMSPTSGGSTGGSLSLTGGTGGSTSPFGGFLL